MSRAGGVHVCQNPSGVRVNTFMRLGTGEGRSVLIVGESPAARGWRLSGRPFYTPEGWMLPSGRYLNEVLRAVGLSVENCSFTVILAPLLSQPLFLVADVRF